MDNTTMQLYDYLVNYKICTENELSLLTSINGTNLDTLESELYSRTGYRNLNQIKELE